MNIDFDCNYYLFTYCNECKKLVWCEYIDYRVICRPCGHESIMLIPFNFYDMLSFMHKAAWVKRNGIIRNLATLFRVEEALLNKAIDVLNEHPDKLDEPETINVILDRLEDRCLDAEHVIHMEFTRLISEMVAERNVDEFLELYGFDDEGRKIS